MKPRTDRGRNGGGFRQRIVRLGVVVAAVVVALGIDAGAQAAAPRQRWAIVPSGDVAKTGLADLLTVELGALPDIDLVDRADIVRVLKEQEVSALMQADKASSRIRTGQLLQADVMLLLAADRTARVPRLGVTMVDCRSGTRLWAGPAVSPEAGIAESAKDVVQICKRTRSRFAGGIRCSIGVLPFVSQDLVHDSDRLRLGLCRLLQEMLLGVPGLAVIEVEEAQAIAAELQGESAAANNRRVPYLLEGEYRTARSSNGVVSVALTLRLKRSGNALEVFRREGLELSGLDPFLREVAARIAKGMDAPAADAVISPRQQFDDLAAQADRLAGLSAFDEALGLREAALLIEPGNGPQRKAILLDYLRTIGNTRTSRAPASDEAECRECIRLWQVAGSHLEYLIRNRLIGKGDACDRIEEYVRSLYVVRTDRCHMLAESEKEKKEFLIRLFAPVESLDRSSGQTVRQGWGRVDSFFLQKMLVRLDGNFLNDEDLAALPRLVAQFAPDARFTSQEWAYVLQGGGTFSDGASAAFCRALQASPNAGIAAAGRYAALRRRYQAVAGTKAVTPDMLEEAQQCVAALRDAGALDFYLDGDTQATVAQIRKDIERFGPKAAGPPVSPAPRPTVVAAAPHPVHPVKPSIALDPLTFRIEPLPGEPGTASAPAPCSVRSVLNCGRFDVLWSDDSLYLHKTNGVLLRVLGGSQALLEDVQWDGQFLWVGTRREGLWVFDAGGRRLRTVGEQDGLPPVAEYVWRVNDARSLLIQPIEPGRVLMVGLIHQNPRRSDSPVRAWCATVAHSADRVEVNVFHEARRLIAGSEEPNPLLFEPAMGFRPTWIREHTDSATGKRFVYIGRDFLDRLWEARKYPLCIELGTLTVTVAKAAPPEPPLVLPAPFDAQRALLAPLSDRPGAWGVSALLDVVAWPRYGGAVARVRLVLPDAEKR